jgi:hypothetical protein
MGTFMSGVSVAAGTNVGRVLALTLVLIAMVSYAAAASPPSAPLPIVPGQAHESSRTERCLGLVLMSDRSASQAHTDPDGLRLRAATFAIDMLSALSSPELPHTAGVVSFGSSAPAINAVGLRPLPDLTRELSTSLADAPTLGGTNFPVAFARVERLIRASIAQSPSPRCPRRRFVVFVYSDLMPNAGGARLDAQFADIRRAVQRVRALNTRVHVFAFSDHRSIADLLRRWQATGASGVVPVRTLSDGALERSYARVLADELGLGEGGTARLSVGAPQSSFVVPELTDRVIVVPFALSRASLRVTSPAGSRREIHGPAVIDRPAAGRWSLALVRGPSSAVGTYAVPATVRITSPGAVVPLGSELRPEVTVSTSTGTPIEAGRSSITVDATAAIDGRARPFEFEGAGDGRFVAEHPIAAARVGDLTIAASIAVGTREVRRVTRTVAVRRIPYLAFTTTSPRGGRPLTATLELRLGGQAVDAAPELVGSPDAAAVASLRTDEREIEQVPVRWKHGSRFEARFSEHVDPHRRYVLTVEMVAREGRVVPSPLTTILTPRSTILDQAVRWGLIALLAIVAILVLVAVAGLARLFFGTRLEEEVVIEVDGTSVSIYGSGRRLTIRGSRWPLRPLTFVYAARGGPVLALQARIPRPWGWRSVQRAASRRHLRRATPIRGGSR